MRHINKVKKLGRKKSHRVSLINNLAKELVKRERIETTISKAKAISPFFDKLVKKAKNQNKELAMRNVNVFLNDNSLTEKLVNIIAPRLKDRNSGYTSRVLTRNRLGDNSQMALVAIVDKLEIPVEKAKKAIKLSKDNK